MFLQQKSTGIDISLFNLEYASLMETAEYNETRYRGESKSFQFSGLSDCFDQQVYKVASFLSLFFLIRGTGFFLIFYAI